MSEAFIAEIRIFPFNFAPRGWAQCNGQLMAISQNTALFSLLGTTYGGDGRSTFALPNLQGSVPMHPVRAGPQRVRAGRDDRNGERHPAPAAAARPHAHRPGRLRPRRERPPDRQGLRAQRGRPRLRAAGGAP